MTNHKLRLAAFSALVASSTFLAGSALYALIWPGDLLAIRRMFLVSILLAVAAFWLDRISRTPPRKR